jgi:hypothetical protein
MIAIYDNGEDFSSHEIVFIDIGDYPIVELRAELRAWQSTLGRHHCGRDGSFEGVTESIEWLDGEGDVCSLERFRSYYMRGCSAR